MDFYGLSVGNTPLYQAVELGDRLASTRGRPIVWVKDESHNPTGTFKDRLAASVLMDHDGYDGPITFATITYGNGGEALGQFCQTYESATGRRRQVASIVDRKLNRPAKRRLAKYGPVIEFDLSGEYLSNPAIGQVARERLGGNARKIVPVGGIDHEGKGYGAISRELYEEGPSRPYVIVPVGEGDLLANMIREFEQIAPDEMPRFIGATIPQNPFCDGRTHDSRLLADKLEAGHSDFEAYLKGLCKRHDYPILTVTSGEIEEEMRMLSGLSIQTCPSSAAAFAGARKYAMETGFEDGSNVVILNTGKEEYRSRRRRITPVLAAAASLLILSGISAGVHYMHKAQTEAARRTDVARYAAEFDIGLLQKHPVEIGEILAYAKLVHLEKIRDGIVKGDPNDKTEVDAQTKARLESACLFSDNLVRMIIQDDPSFRATVDSFYVWKARKDRKKGMNQE